MKYLVGLLVAVMTCASASAMVLQESAEPYQWKYDNRTNTPHARWYRVGGEAEPVVPETVTLTGVYFDTNTSTLQTTAYPVLTANVVALKSNPYVNVTVAGYTDSQGSEVYNQLLSEARAKTVYDYFVSQGVSASRLSYKGYGEANPVDSNETAAGRANNRRIELYYGK